MITFPNLFEDSRKITTFICPKNNSYDSIDEGDAGKHSYTIVLFILFFWANGAYVKINLLSDTSTAQHVSFCRNKACLYLPGI